MDKRIEQRISELESSKEMYERILTEPKMENSPSRGLVENELNRAKEEIEKLKNIKDEDADAYFAELAEREHPTLRENRFVISFDKCKFPCWAVNNVVVDEANGELHISFNESKLFFAKEFFQKYGKGIKNDTAQITYLNALGEPIAKTVVEKVKFKREYTCLHLNYNSENQIRTQILFTFPKKNCVKHASTAN